jgi:hypothetical protein
MELGTDIRLEHGTYNAVPLLERVKVVQQRPFLHLPLVTAVSGHSHLQSLAERHYQAAT